MPASEPRLLARKEFDAASLVAAHPPRITDANKRLVHSIACPPGAAHRGAVVVSRWHAVPLPAALPAAAPELRMREDVYTYAPEPAARPAVEWHVNFADLFLFVAYGSGLFAQDEMQAAEHPALGSVREALLAAQDPALPPTTRDGAVPTPILLRGVERRCAVDTAHDAAMPYGLYGNRFARASPDVVRKATTRIDPPTITNLIAMEAPPGGNGRYTRAQIEEITTTATTAFSAAVLESGLAAAAPAVVVHTGHWGTGAYGGNRVLMAALQMLAARLAGIDVLVFHTFDADGSEAWTAARTLVDSLIATHSSTASLLDTIEARGFSWGVSDGN
ncbi:hypothetical protein [Sorangium sp. So ce117]|uniref:hypothetical protein n=1 Tax=Sorangium sp. So ce117 TaxID=3133277 RepID=UPI003F5FA4F9